MNIFMEHTHYLEHLVKLQKQGTPQGICSICSANPFVIEAALEHGLQHETHVLIEATCNQVNQYGGYTGMKAQDFVEFVHGIAEKLQFPEEKLLLGGDHLGPNPWQDEPASQAMEKASELVRSYVAAGFTKIHLDPSMFLADDSGDRMKPLDSALVAERTASFCLIAEEAFQKYGGANSPPVYVIGTEVPIPGGIQDSTEELHVTTVESLQETVEISREAFSKKGLSDAWKRVIGIVVQPGVEYGDQTIYEYQREQAGELCAAAKEIPTLVLEGHSTDYQRGSFLRQMVEDGIAILKVGPELTFAMREAIFSLCSIEQELAQFHAGFQPSKLIEILDQAMMNNPGYWEKYYSGNEQEQHFARKYSLSDRSRYYWTEPMVQQSLQQLLSNLEHITVPLPLLSQFLPQQYKKIRDGILGDQPRRIIRDRIIEVLDRYSYAIHPSYL